MLWRVKKTNYFSSKNLITASCVVIALAIGYYFVIFSPSIEKQKLAIQQASMEQEQKRDTQQNKISLTKCLEEQRQTVISEFDNSCKATGHWQDKENRCDVYEFIADKDGVAKTILNNGKAKEDECYTLYPQQ